MRNKYSYNVKALRYIYSCTYMYTLRLDMSMYLVFMDDVNWSLDF